MVVQRDQFVASGENNFVARIPFAGVKNFEIELYGIAPSKISIDKVNNAVFFVGQHTAKIISTADRLLTGLYECRDLTSLPAYEPGDLKYRPIGCYLDKEFEYTNTFRVVMDLEDKSVIHKLSEYYGQRYLVYVLYGTRAVLIGTEWSY